MTDPATHPTPPTPTADDEYTIAVFSDLAERYGVDVRSLNWGSRASQFQRFAVLAQACPLHGRRVLDVGCGLGDFWAWAEARRLGLDYVGIDITPKMVETARARFPGVRFDVASAADLRGWPERSFDVVVASGIFAYRRADPTGYVRETVAAMFALCRTAVAFNSLSAWSAARDEGEFHADPLETLAFCRTLTPWVALRHDYHHRDFTVYLYRQEHGA